MSLKAKIITKLKEVVKAEGTNLSNARINGIADRIDAKVDTEEAIDAEIENLNALLPFKELAALDDAKRNADKKAAEDADKTDPKPADPATPPAPDKKEGDEMPSWFKQHVETQNKVIETLTTKLSAFEQGNVVQSRRQRLEAKLKDAPEKFKARVLRDFDRLKFDSEDEYTSYEADIEQDIAEEVQANAEAGAVGPRASGIGGGDLSKVKPASDKELEAAVSTLKI